MAAAGTTAYIAPEQARGAYGPKADVWALGCLLLEMLVPTWRNKVLAGGGTGAVVSRSKISSAGATHQQVQLMLLGIKPLRNS